MEEVEPVALEDPVGAGGLPPAHLQRGVGHFQQANVSRSTGSCWKKKRDGEILKHFILSNSISGEYNLERGTYKKMDNFFFGSCLQL